jgi:hypothetical protein
MDVDFKKLRDVMRMSKAAYAAQKRGEKKGDVYSGCTDSIEGSRKEGPSKPTVTNMSKDSGPAYTSAATPSVPGVSTSSTSRSNPPLKMNNSIQIGDTLQPSKIKPLNVVYTSPISTTSKVNDFNTPEPIDEVMEEVAVPHGSQSSTMKLVHMQKDTGEPEVGGDFLGKSKRNHTLHTPFTASRRPALLSSVRQHMITKTVTTYWARIREAEIVDLKKWTNKILGANRRARTEVGSLVEEYGRRRMEVDICIRGKMQRQSVRRSTRVMRLIMDK